MNRLTGLLILLALVSASGCIVDSGPPEPVTFTGTLNATEAGFTMDGDVLYGGRGDPTFSNVTVSLLTAEGAMIHAERVGTLERRLPVSITTERVPHYVVIDSPSFWEHPDVEVSYFERNDDGVYSARVVASQDKLPE